MNPEFNELLSALYVAEARFLVVGAYALALHGHPRSTGDLDIWVEPTPENAARVMQALRRFGAPLGKVREADFSRPGIVFQVGVRPLRIDLLTDLTGLTFEEAWPDRMIHRFGPFEAPFLGKESFIKNKRATGRPQDLVDAEQLEKG